MKIVVLAGGLSPERDVSLSSSCLIANALMDKGNEVILMDLYLGMDIPEEGLSSLYVTKKDGKRHHYEVPGEEPDLDALREEYGENLVGKNVIEICKDADVVFLGLHGDIGENGKLQALFDIYNITYTGTGHIGSLLAMDKQLTKRLFDHAGIPSAPWFCSSEPKAKTAELLYPIVVKPIDGGSSIGVSIAHDEKEFEEAVHLAKKYAKDYIIEQYIEGREFSVGVLDGEVLPPIEIIPKEGFYDYKHKYQAGLTLEICPAELTEDETRRIQKIALDVYELLELSSYSRVDFMMGKDGNFYCLEANTLPGMTPTSLIPQEAKAHGISYEDLCMKVALLAMKGKRP